MATLSSASASAAFSRVLSRVLVIDPAVLDYQQLLEGLRPGYELLLLDHRRDGVAQISEALANYARAGVALESLHILSHGSPGTVYLGSNELSLDSLSPDSPEGHAPQVAGWGAVVDAVVFYGCNVAAGDAGAEFVEWLHELTGARIAASVTRTGSAKLGGDWQLLVQGGKAEAGVAELAFDARAIAAYAGVLEDIDVDIVTDELDGDLTAGDVSLREAITQANGNGDDSDTIELPEGTFTLSLAGTGDNTGESGDLDITSGTITIRGVGEGQTIIDADSLDRVFDVLNGATLILENVTVTGGAVAGKGGGIRVNSDGNLILINSSVSGNSTNANANANFSVGGGIYNGSDGTVILTNSSVSDNSTNANFSAGGGIYNNDGTVILTNSTVSGNSTKANLSAGGGIYSSEGTVTLTNSTVSGNSTSGISSNGGGIYNSAGTVTLTNSTVSDNSTNHVSSNGGGLYSSDAAAVLNLGNSIVAGNTARGSGDEVHVADPSSTINFSGVNLFGESSRSNGNAFSNFTPSDDDITATSDGNTPTALDDILSPLGDNGGSTQTHALPDTSPAVDAGNASTFFAVNETTLGVDVNGDGDTDDSITTDQRGSDRINGTAVVGGSDETATFVQLIDIGAVERDSDIDNDSPVVNIPIDDQTILTGAALNLALPEDTFTDPDSGDSLTYSATLADNSPLPDWLSFDTETLTFSGTPSAVDTGSLTINLTATDSQAATVTDSFDLTVTTDGPVEINVDTTTDETDGRLNDGDISLRDAIIAANTNGNGDDNDTINLPTGTFTLSLAGTGENAAATGDLDITSGTLTIRGAGEGQTIIDANSLDRVFDVWDGATLILEDITVTGGTVSAKGGGIRVNSNGNLTLLNSTVSGNSTDGTFADGGGIYNDNGAVTLTNSTVSGNSTTDSGSDGGGISNGSGTVTLTNSTISGNSISGDNAEGGGISNSSGTVTLTNSTVTGNSATGSNSDGGGIYTSAVLNLANSIVAGNTATGAGDEVSTFDLSSTINLSGVNLFGDSSNANAEAFDNFTPSDNDITATSDGNMPTELDDILSPLDDNGGPTLTHALSGNSPAIDAGDADAFNAVTEATLGVDVNGDGDTDDAITTDQRGISRFINGQNNGAAAVVDIGAVERDPVSDNSAPVLNTSIDNQIINAGDSLDFAIPADTFTDSDPGDSLTYSATLADNSPLPDWLSFDPDTLTFSGTPTADDIGSLGINLTATDSQAATVTDSFDLTIATEEGVVEITVDTTTDEADGRITDGDISLRDAIIAANTNGNDNDAIFLSAGTFTLSLAGTDEDAAATGDLDITSGTITIRGAGEGQTIIDANSLDRVFDVWDGATLILEDVTVTGGSVLSDASVTLPLADQELVKGGGIRVNSNSNLTLTNSAVSGNSTSGDFSDGGGIYNDNGTVTLTNSTVSGNSTSGSNSHGGGIYNDNGTVTLTDSTVSGNSTSGGNSNGGGIYNDNGTLTLTNSTVSGNSTSGDVSDGGGIYNSDGTVTLTNSTVSDNSTSEGSSEGGGIYNFGGAVTFTNSTVSGNSTNGDNAQGGGIFNIEGAITLDNSTVTGNSTNGANSQGGGIYSKRGSLALSNSTVSGNSTIGNKSYGGGVYNESAAITLADSTVSGNSTSGNNSAGGGIYNNYGAITLSNSTVSGNSTSGNNSEGGGIYNDDGTITLSNSTVSGNSTSGNNADGGGIYNDYGTITLANSTVSGNSTSGDDADGGGVYSYEGIITLTNSTISDNRASGNNSEGGGIATESQNAVLNLANSIVAGNTAAGAGDEISTLDSSSTINLSGVNLLGDSSNSTAEAFNNFTPSDDDITATSDGNTPTELDDILSSLGDNGGPTQTHALPDGSPALDAGNNATFTAVTETTLGIDVNGDGDTDDAITTDQRGDSRFVNSQTGGAGAIIDIGAVERSAANGNSSPIVNIPVDNQTINAGDTLNVTLPEDSFTDPDPGDSLTYSATLVDSSPLPDWLSFDTETLTFSGTPSTDDIGFLTINLTAADNQTATVTDSFDLTIASETGLVEINVDTTTDETDGSIIDGDISLRDAIIAANTNGNDNDTINLSAGTFTLSLAGTDEDVAATGDLDITSGTITIRGAGEGQTIIDANSLDRVFDVWNGATLILEDVTVTGGAVTGSGDSGGGIRVNSNGSLTLTNSTVSGNSTSGELAQGGGIYNNNGTVTLTNSTVSDNRMTSDKSRGGGIANDNGGTVTLTNSTISGNRTTGADSKGSGIYNDAGTVTLLNSTISGNRTTGVSSNGGGIYSLGGAITLLNSTISDNRLTGALSDGGGIFATGILSLTNSIVAGNRASRSGDEIKVSNSPTLNLSGVNILGDSSNSNAAAFDNFTPSDTDITATSDGNTPTALDDILSSLSDNGGPTQTHALPVGSPALDAGDNAAFTAVTEATLGIDVNGDGDTDDAITTDQRGGDRFIDAGEDDASATIDIGAVEQDNFSLVVNTFTERDSSIIGNVSLRDAIITANTNGNANDTIELSAGTFTLSLAGTDEEDAATGDLDITSGTITIRGAEDGQTTIDANSLDRVFDIRNGAALILENITVTGGAVSDNGGGIRVNSDGNLTLINSTVTGNSTSGNNADGGGIYNGDGTVTLTNSTVSGNSTTGEASEGGGIRNYSGALTLTNSTISGNSTSGFDSGGGGLYNENGTTTLSNSTISGNSTSGDISVGGGIGNRNGTLTLTNSTITSNSITSNYAYGGGIYSSSNTGAVLNLANSIVAGNTATTAGDEIRVANASSTTITLSGVNLFGDSSNTNAEAFRNFTPSDTDITATSDGNTPTALDDILSPLGDNGGPTQTHALPNGSPALDAGDNDTLNAVTEATLGIDVNGDGDTDDAITTDQRGGDRFIDAGEDGAEATIDIGAVEQDNFSLVVNTFTERDSSIIGDVSLRDAIITANTNGNDNDTIELSAGTFTLGLAGTNEQAAATGDLDITSGTLTIRGSEDGQTTIDANSLDRVFDIRRGSELILENITVTGGAVSGNGGGIRVGSNGNLTLLNSTVTSNTTSGNNSDGGGIHNRFGTVTLTNSTVTGNSTTDDASDGGGISNYTGTLTLTNSTVTGNSTSGRDSDGGGIYNYYGATVLNDSTVSGNSVTGADSDGDDIENVGGTVIESSSIVINNAPIINSPIDDQTITEGDPLDLTIPADTFTDPDPRDNLTYSATLADNSPLPAWLRFDSATLTFSGTPTADDIGALTINLTATDLQAATVTDSFELAIVSPPEAGEGLIPNPGGEDPTDDGDGNTPDPIDTGGAHGPQDSETPPPGAMFPVPIEDPAEVINQLGSGDDFLVFIGGDSDREFNGNGGNDTFFLGEGSQRANLGSGTDTVFAGGGDDLIRDNGGVNNRLFGEAGDDLIVASAGGGIINGGSGFDTIEINGAQGYVVQLELDASSGIDTFDKIRNVNAQTLRDGLVTFDILGVDSPKVSFAQSGNGTQVSLNGDKLMFIDNIRPAQFEALNNSQSLFI